MINWVIDALAGAPEYLAPIIVVGYGGEQIKLTLGDKYRYVEQTELSGTATAVKAALPLLEDSIPCLVLFGDNPFITTDSITRMRNTFVEAKTKMAFFSVTLRDFDDWRSSFKGFGRVKRGLDGEVLKLVEYKNATEEEREIKEVTPGGFCFDSKWLKDTLPKVKANTETTEYYLTDLVEMAILDGRQVFTVPLPPEEAIGINSVDDAEQAKRRR